MSWWPTETVTPRIEFHRLVCVKRVRAYKNLFENMFRIRIVAERPSDNDEMNTWTATWDERL